MPANKQRCVLCVDDEDTVIDTFERAFAGQDEFVLDVAKTVETALQKIEQIFYDLVFLDMKMGTRYAGMKVLREIVRLEIKAEAAGQKIVKARMVIMSGSVSFDDFMPEAYELGALCFVPKPISF